MTYVKAVAVLTAVTLCVLIASAEAGFGAQPEVRRSAAVYLEGDTAFVSAGPYGLSVVDVSDPHAPRRIGAYGRAGWALSSALHRGHVYVAAGYGGLHVVDVSDPSEPRRANWITLSDDVHGVLVRGALLYEGSEIGLRTWSLADATLPQLQGTLEIRGPTWSIALVGTTAYLAAGSSGLHIVDVSDTTRPAPLGTYNMDWARGIDVASGIAYVAGSTDGLFIFDVGDPQQPHLIAVVDTPGYATAVDVESGFAFVGDWATGVQIIDVSDPATAFLAASHPVRGRVHGVTVRDSTLYAATTHGSLVLLDVADPAHPRELGQYRPFQLFVPHVTTGRH